MARAFVIPPLLRDSAGIFCLQAALSPRTPKDWRHFTRSCIMKSQKKTDHLERTAKIFREEVVSPAKVCGIINESKTVRRLRLLVASKEFAFKAGQWVDFFIPGVPVVGGFSICSSPRLLEQESALELAVKYTNHPPSTWVHTKCALDSEVALRVGGEFFFDPQPSDASVNLVLIAGGVGINPLNSILLHVADLYRHWENKGSGYKMGRVRLFYSARNTNELLFKKSILDLTNAFPGKIVCSFHVTQQTTEISKELQPYVTEGRISDKDLEEHISKDTVFFICGPPPMIEHFSAHLEARMVPRERIRFEKWW
ncbi:oxidoreductase NAD-binding domain-containing protein 1 [Monodelphis domestica]|uniref:Oxidoreductase NAD-binding domain-containing protein 1 n=1 Tax=Monodelphis domestica TaxID=13616 RepID=F7A3W4_MONDO|nr:oxidoreductase NAD-binding domain-containing protein 1 [Monodelphis domestica]XP_007505188.1 oxidoreductase NAD-binding domain-containing protein 1 [Monodelphis domestica]